MAIRNARLRVTPRGVRYLSPGLILEITPAGITLVAAGPLPAATQRRVLRVIDRVALGLGFEPPGGGESDQFPPLGSALAIRPLIRTSAAAAEQASLMVSEAQDLHRPRDVGEAPMSEAIEEIGKDRDDPEFGM